MPKKTVIGTFYFNADKKNLAERFRWRMKHQENVANSVEMFCRVDKGNQIVIEMAFESRRQLDWANGYAFGLIELAAYPEDPSRTQPIITALNNLPS